MFIEKISLGWIKTEFKYFSISMCQKYACKHFFPIAIDKFMFFKLQSLNQININELYKGVV